MSYPAYTVPDATGIQWRTGQGTLQDFPGQYLSTEAQAQAVVAATGGKLVNAALEAVPGVAQISGVAPDAPYQPWWVVGGGPAGNITGPIGPAVQMQSAYNPINGGGVGNPGNWTGIGTPNLKWVPTVVAPVPPVPIDSSGDPASYFGALDGTDAAAAIAYAKDTHRLVVALAKAQGIS